MKKSHWLLVSFAGLLAIAAIAWQIWSYAASFTVVTFTFDTPQGNARIVNSQGDARTITPNTPTRLKKGTYTLTTYGDGFANTAKELTVDKATTIPVAFSFTEQRLQSLFIKEQPAIHQVLVATYPSLWSLYTIHHETLYGKGDVYGATLRFIDTTSDQRDTLHILLQKKGDAWQIRSKPPVPVLSAPRYPDISIDILRAINLGE